MNEIKKGTVIRIPFGRKAKILLGIILIGVVVSLVYFVIYPRLVISISNQAMNSLVSYIITTIEQTGQPFSITMGEKTVICILE